MKGIDTSLTVQISQHRTAIMGISILSIMLFHQYFTSVFPFDIFHNIGYWGVDVFLFLSGMGLVHSLKKNTITTYYKRRLVRLAPSCILCGTIKYAIYLAFGSALDTLKDGLNFGVWTIASLDLWFIHAIIILYAVSPVLYKSLSKWPYISSFVILIIFLTNELTIRPRIGFDWLNPVGVTAWTLERLPVFSAGMMVSIGLWTIDSKKPLSFVFLLLAICLGLLSKTNFTFYGIQACLNLCLILGMPALILLCIMMLNITPRLLHKAFVFLGEHSLELYLVHEFIFWSIKISFEDANPYCLLVLSFMLSCMAAYCVKQVTNKI